MRPLGVGVVYWTALDPLVRSDCVEVVELEPQTLWTKALTTSGWTYRLNEPLFDAVANLPQPKLLHGVGHPLAGTVDDPIEALPLLRRMAERLDAPWVSEHLSFNRVRRGAQVHETGFLLPPSQTAAGARVAAAGVRRFRRALGRPTAFETGVNYFRPQPGEIDDGAYFAGVAAQADCGIVLDLHNLWCNERNGRQPVSAAVAQLPLDRVWELHFAGGMALDGFWLDAHSGAIPPAVLELAADLIPRLPRLGALIFEILPEHLDRIGLEGVQRELETLHALWRLRAPTRPGAAVPSIRSHDAAPAAADLAAARAWEAAVADSLARPPCGPLAADPGAPLLRKLVRDFRSANITRAMKFTLTTLLLSLGADSVRTLLDDYFVTCPPDAFAAAEAHQFGTFLTRRPHLLAAVPHLAEVLAFERALIGAALLGESATVEWHCDPAQLLEELDQGRLPGQLPPAHCRMTVSA
jgi:uncharacterized protein